MAELLEQHRLAPYDSDWYRKGLALREEVFIQEQNVPFDDEHDGKDQNATHLISVQGNEVVGVLRILWLEPHAKIGRFAVKKSMRNQGVGSRLFQFALSFIEQQGQENIMLEAQIDRVAFYEEFGFESYGKEYMDAGIKHLAMKNY